MDHATIEAPSSQLTLSRVHLHDYKSYRGTVTVGPFSQHLTTIVGPNGAGKSTVIDGILFALGAYAYTRLHWGCA